jgi:hypothetical protein
MATGVEIVLTNIYDVHKERFSASTLGSASQIKLDSATHFNPAIIFNDAYFTQRSISSSIINEDFYKFLSNLEQRNIDAIILAVKKIKSYPFVNSIDFKYKGTPTFIITLPEVNRGNENKIYAIEYQLMKKTRINFDFYIDFP